MGAAVGPKEGVALGFADGLPVGAAVGMPLGTKVGVLDGAALGFTEGVAVGPLEGPAVGVCVGVLEGCVGSALGAYTHDSVGVEAVTPQMDVEHWPQPKYFRVGPYGKVGLPALFVVRW